MKKNVNAYEKTYEEKLKENSKVNLIIFIVLELIGTYCTLMVLAYDSMYPHLPFQDKISNGLSMILENPTYFLPIDYPLTYLFVVDMALALICLITYSTGASRIHHNTNTIKGSAEWQDANDFTKIYASYAKR